MRGEKKRLPTTTSTSTSTSTSYLANITTETDFLGRVQPQYQVLVVCIVDNNNINLITYYNSCRKYHNESYTQNSE